MIQCLLDALQGYFPLLIDEIVWNDPTLIIRGKDWNFYTMEPWRIIDKEKLICGYHDDSKSDILLNLQSDAIVSVSAQSLRLPIDIAFEFSSGRYLEVFSVGGYEPWVFKVLSKLVYVASPHDPDSFK